MSPLVTNRQGLNQYFNKIIVLSSHENFLVLNGF